MLPPEEKERELTLREALSHFWRLVDLIRPYWFPLWKVIILGFITALIGLVPPHLSKKLIDQVLPSNNIQLMHLLVCGILALAIATASMGALKAYFAIVVGSRLSNVIALEFFNHLQHLPVRFFDNHRVGEVMSRFQDVRISLNTITSVFQTLFLNGVYLILIPPLLFILQWKLAVLALIGVPLTVAITVHLSRITKRYWKRTTEALGELSAFQVESLANIRTIKSLALESHVYRRGRDQASTVEQLQLKAGRLGQAFGFVNGVLYSSNTALFTWYGWTLILSGRMSLGEFIAFSIYVGYLYGPVTQLVNLISDFQQSSISLARMFEYLDHPVEQSSDLAYHTTSPIIVKISGTISFRDVSFGYSNDRSALSEISFDIQKGTRTAIVGSSGSGKTTLLRLITGMERPQMGEILIDGKSIEQIPLQDLRRQIPVVWQDAGLLKGTIWENLTAGLDRPSRGEVEKALKICQLENLISQLPTGIDTPISEWGTSVSAGQRQRLAIARALIRGGAIFLMDEAMANVDVRTESEVLRDLFSWVKKKTIIYTTHRLKSALLADSIIVLQDGRVVGSGSHRELLRSSVTYVEMVECSMMKR